MPFSSVLCHLIDAHDVGVQISAEEQKKMDEKVMVDGVKRVVSKLLARRKLKRSYEYEVQWEGQPSSSDYTAWLSRDRSVASSSWPCCPCLGMSTMQISLALSVVPAQSSGLVCMLCLVPTVSHAAGYCTVS